MVNPVTLCQSLMKTDFRIKSKGFIGPDSSGYNYEHTIASMRESKCFRKRRHEAERLS